jgi:CBS domain-containing protein
MRFAPGAATRFAAVASGRKSRTELNEEPSMTTARDLMTKSAECVNSTETLVDAARKMRDLDVGALPICGEDQRLKGMLTDRDIVLKCIAEGKDPNAVRAGDLAQGKPVTIGADDSAEETLRTMAKYQVRRLPVIDGHKLVGIVAQADVAKSLPHEVVGQVLEEISEH